MKITESLSSFFDMRKTLISVILGLLLIVLMNRWHDSLTQSLQEKREELSESLALLETAKDLSNQGGDLEALKKLRAKEAEVSNWTDSIAPLVAEQKLILRQVRPLGTDERGKNKEEKLFVQVEGNVDGFLGLLHHIASDEAPIYITRYDVTVRTLGTGFISAELVISRLVI